MTYRTEFPDFPEADMPAIPEGFEDASWVNEGSPHFLHAPLRLELWVDYADPEKSELPEQRADGSLKRFGLYRVNVDDDGAYLDDTREILAESDDWNEVLAAIIGEQFAAIIREVTTEAEFADIRRRNALPEYAGDCCATHDFMDANEQMAEAFEKVMGREPSIGDDPASQADMALWNAAWAIAKPRHFTASAGEPKPLDAMTAEYAEWTTANGFAEFEGDALELLMVEGSKMTPEQIGWINEFSERWQDAQDAEDHGWQARAKVTA